MSQGVKLDDGKIEYHLIEPEVLEQLALVLMFGADKYGEGNWKKLENIKRRYHNALTRHMEAIRKGELYDPESKLFHTSHAMACVHFLSWVDVQEEKLKNKS